MSAIQDLRDKIHRKDGQPFKLRDLNSKEKRDYFNLRELVKLRELTCEGSGRNAIYQATAGLKLRKAAKDKLAPVLELQGWRLAFPSMFNPVELQGKKTVHRQPMV